MNNTEIFLEKYKELEKVVRYTYKLSEKDSISHYLNGQTKYKRYASQLSYCQKVRNILVHENKIHDNFAVNASDDMIRFIDDLIDVVSKRQKCFNLQISFTNVYWRSLSDTVKDTITEMQRKLFTHIPILDHNGYVIGVFDENSIFTYIANEEIVCIDEKLRFSDIEKYLSISNREMESFIFVKSNSYVDELEEKIESAFNKGKRIGIAFVTTNGTEKEKLQGIITPWDIISHQDR